MARLGLATGEKRGARRRSEMAAWDGIGTTIDWSLETMNGFMSGRPSKRLATLWGAVLCVAAPALTLPAAALASAPTVRTLEAISVGRTEVVLDAVVDPASQITYVKVEVGYASSEWCSSKRAAGAPGLTTSSLELPSSDKELLVGGELRGVSSGSRYCYEFVAENASGVSHGGQIFFTAGAPAVFTGEAREVGSSTTTIEGEVEPAQQATHYWVDYAKASSSWCQSKGASGAPEGSGAHSLLGFEDSEFHEVAASLAGLVSGTEYCAELVAEDESGANEGGQVLFKTTGSPPPPSYGLTVSVEGSGTGTVSGSGVSCPGSCSGSYLAGSKVTLTATPASGSTFTGWGGACSGTGACEVTMNAAEHVSAVFTQSPPEDGNPPPGGNTPPPASSNPPPAGGGNNPEGEVAAARESRAVLLASSTIEVQGDGVALAKLECRGASRCHGKLTLTVRQRGKGKAVHVVSIGAVTCSLSAHHRATVEIKLSSAGRRMLASAHGRLGAHLALQGLQGTAPTRAQVSKVLLVMQKGKGARARPDRLSVAIERVSLCLPRAGAAGRCR
jgi:Divergent InlB B-repeat domain